MEVNRKTPRILRLDEVTINRIAAGEVVQSPSAAIKEMLENSIDAGSTSITVTVKRGGLQSLQIQDNGHGIRKDDLNIVCERFTTSKISNYDDLKSVTTFGFRGEALASITHVAHVSILTRTCSDPCAYKARYADGRLIPFSSGDKADPKPCAGNVGTTITVEDLFYNMQTRRAALGNHNEQYQKILDVITRYAVHYGGRGVSITCKRAGVISPDLHTNISTSTLDTIKGIYGPILCKELLPLAAEQTRPFNEENARQGRESLAFKCNGYISNGNYSSKKRVFMLFINNRLVDSAPLKRIIDSVYSEILPKHSYPFVYLSLEIPPQHVDVNVHPTKREVHFLFEDDLLSTLHQSVLQTLRSANESRVFYTQSVLLNYGGSCYSANNQTRNTEHDKESKPRGSDIGMVTNTSQKRPFRNAFLASSQEGGAVIASDLDLDFLPVAADQDLDLETASDSRSKYVPVASEALRVSEQDGQSTDGSAVPEVKPSGRADGTEGITQSLTQSPQPCPVAPRVEGTQSKTRAHPTPAHKLVRVDPSIPKIDGIFLPLRPDQPGPVLDPVQVGDEALCLCPVIESADAGDLSRDSLSRARDRGGGEVNLQCSCCGQGKNARPAALVRENTTSLSTPSLSAIDNDELRYLLSEIKSSGHCGLMRILRRHEFVGIVDDTHSLVQAGTQLLLLNHRLLAEELFYQLSLVQLGSMRQLVIDEPPSLLQVVLAGLEQPEAQWSAEDGDKDQLAARICQELYAHADLLRDWFRIDLDQATDSIRGMPDLLPGHHPCPETLPVLVIRIAADVRWDSDRAMIEDIARLLGSCYADLGVDPGETSSDERSDCAVGLRAEAGDGWRSQLSAEGKDMLLKFIFPALRSSRHYIPSVKAADEAVTQVAALEKLYKVFERC